jgi:hypothetical protein
VPEEEYAQLGGDFAETSKLQVNFILQLKMNSPMGRDRVQPGPQKPGVEAI